MIPEDVQSNPVVAALLERLPDAVLDARIALGELAISVAPQHIVAVCRHLKDDQKFNRFSSTTCVDWFPREPRFEIVYHVHSIERNLWLRVKTMVSGETPEIESVYSVWRGADWYEREVFDLFGVVFRNHPNLKRLMMPDNWVGHPLRKDYPVHGYKYSYAEEK